MKEDILGRKVYAKVSSPPQTPDLAVVVIPQARVIPVTEDYVNRGIRAGIIISSGFAKAGK